MPPLEIDVKWRRRKRKSVHVGSDEEMNMTEERGRETRWDLGWGIRDFNAGLTPCSHTTTTKSVNWVLTPGRVFKFTTKIKRNKQETRIT